jgi:hypothetical protein
MREIGNGQDDLRWAREHYSGLLREAARARLAQQALAERQHFLERTLAWLGGRLVAWGSYLQERYGASCETPGFQIADAGR